MNTHESGPLLELLGAATGERDQLVRAGAVARLPKGTLNVVAEAVKRAFAASLATRLMTGLDPDAPPLVIGLFQHELYFAPERARYGAYAASGATVIVGYPGLVSAPAPGVFGVDTTGRSELVDAWVLAVLNSPFGGVLVGLDDRALLDGPTLETARSFLGGWSFRRNETVDAIRQILRPLRTRLPLRALALCEGALRAAELEPASRVEDPLAVAIDALAPLLGVRPRRSTRDELRHRDLLTGLYTSEYLTRFTATASGRSATRVAALLIDVDDLGKLNATHGEVAGDTAMVAIAATLSDERRDGDIVVRWADDEFLVLAPARSEEEAVSLADRFLVAIRALRLPAPYESESVTVSIGVALADPADLPHDRLRQALGQAKVLGKNVVRLAD